MNESQQARRELDTWFERFVAKGMREINALLAKHAAFADYCEETDNGA